MILERRGGVWELKRGDHSIPLADEAFQRVAHKLAGIHQVEAMTVDQFHTWSTLLVTMSHEEDLKTLDFVGRIFARIQFVWFHFKVVILQMKRDMNLFLARFR